MKTYYGLISAGGHGWEVMPMLRSMIRSEIANGNVELVFVVENLKEESLVSNHRPISLETFFALDGNKRFNVAIGDSRVRQRIADLCLAQGIKSFPVLARSAILLDDNKIGEGAMISEQTIITSNVRIGHFFQANCQCNIAHNCVIGHYVTFAPSVKCTGTVTIGDHAYVVAGAVIKQGRYGRPLLIGEGSVVGMGAVVIQDVEPYTTVVGNPARSMVK